MVDPNPYQIWRDVDARTWCSPYSNEVLSTLVEDISVLSEADDAEAYYRLDDVYQVLREHGKHSST